MNEQHLQRLVLNTGESEGPARLVGGDGELAHTAQGVGHVFGVHPLISTP